MCGYILGINEQVYLVVEVWVERKEFVVLAFRTLLLIIMENTLKVFWG